MMAPVPAVRQFPAPVLRRLRRQAARTGVYLLVSANIAVLLLPIAWMASTALKPRSEVFLVPPVWIPVPTLAGFAALLSGHILTFFENSLIVASGSALLATCCGALTAYGLARISFRGGDAVLIMFLAAMAFPVPLLMISMYTLFGSLGLLDTYLALILANAVVALPVVVWLLKGFFDSLPVEVEEAAFIDGASVLQTLLRVVFPMSRPGLAAAAIFVFVTSWNEFAFGLTFTSSTDMRPLPAGISLLFLQEFQYQWPEMMAVAIVATLPILLLFLLFQRNFVEGVTTGAVKG
jgi:ABC-type glycerol-3-phosphate transport system permease component